MRKLNKGFTLVELLVVIAIIGVLASVVLVSLNSARTRARDARRISDVHQIALALEGYYDAGVGRDGTAADTGNDYPSLTDAATSLGLLVSGGFIGAIPKDPQDSAKAYKYAALGSGDVCSGYHLGIDLEDTGHSALKSDADAAAGTGCTGSTDFNGSGVTTCGTTGTGELCYDVKP